MSQRTTGEKIALIRSWVRVWVTYAAAAYVFGGGLWMIYVVSVYKFKDDVDQQAIEHMKDIFLAVLPIATGVITYWFASVGRGKSKDGD